MFAPVQTNIHLGSHHPVDHFQTHNGELPSTLLQPSAVSSPWASQARNAFCMDCMTSLWYIPFLVQINVSWSIYPFSHRNHSLPLNIFASILCASSRFEIAHKDKMPWCFLFYSLFIFWEFPTSIGVIEVLILLCALVFQDPSIIIYDLLPQY